MSGADIHPESEEEYQERAESLMQDAAETKQELDAKQNEALEAIAEGGQLEDYETVFLGDLEIEVKGWLPGDVADTVEKAQRIAEDGEKTDVRESMETMLSALSEMTVNETYNMSFWRKYYSKYGPEGVILAVTTIMEPASDSMEERKEGVESFRSEHQ